MIHHVFANKSNIGDWLSALGIQSLLPGATINEHLCDQPFVDKTSAALRKVSADDLIVVGGGGLFMDYFEPFWTQFEPIAERVPFCIWGVGYCDLKLEPSRAPTELLQRIVDRARLCVVRDDLSRRHLGRPSLPEPVFCPSLSVVQPSAELGFGLMQVDNYTTVGAAAYDVYTPAAEAFAERTGRPYRSTSNRITPGHTRELEALLKKYAAADLVVSSALHGCILGIGMGKKVLAISGDYKIEQFMDAVGLGEWVLSQEDVAQVPDRLEELPQQASAKDAVRVARQQHRRIADQILHLAGVEEAA
jgi:polysaccharide pyruvyl transferase WcaK-like protein